MKDMKISLTLSEAQYQVFAPAAKDLGTDVGSFLLALACDGIETTPGAEYPKEEIKAMLWRFVHTRDVPDPDTELIAAGVKFCGQERIRKVLLREVAS